MEITAVGALPGSWAVAAVVKDGYLYAMGGCDSNKCFRYSPSLDQWEPLPDMIRRGGGTGLPAEQ
jgi:hypothetical protein